MKITNKQLIEEVTKIFKNLNEKIELLENEVKEIKKQKTEKEKIDKLPQFQISNLATKDFQIEVQHLTGSVNRDDLTSLCNALFQLCITKKIRAIKFMLK